jgi:hypothetical protein
VKIVGTMKTLKDSYSLKDKKINPIPFERFLTFGVIASFIVHGLLVIGFIYFKSTESQVYVPQPKPFIVEIIVETKVTEPTIEPPRDPKPLQPTKLVPKPEVQTKINLTTKTPTFIQERRPLLTPKPKPTPHDIPPPPQLRAGKLVNERQSNGGSSIRNSQANKSKAEKKSTQNRKTEDQIDNDYPVDAETLVVKKSSFKKEGSDFDKDNVQENGKGKGQGSDLGDQEKSELTQTERDVILAQIIKHWRFNLTSPEAKELTINGSVVVLPSGMLAPPFNGNDPWDLGKAMPQYEQYVKNGNTFLSELMFSFYTALRLSQPFDLPASAEGTWPKKISISFRFKDLPNRPYSPTPLYTP